MMGHYEPLKGGDEYDAFTKWRHVLVSMDRPGRSHRIKQLFSRRTRRAWRRRCEVARGRFAGIYCVQPLFRGLLPSCL